MKTMKYIKPIVIISLIAIVYFIFSCKKDTSSTIIINGRVFDPNQNTYVANANVQFLSSKIQSGTYNPSYNTVASATTDASGNFHIEYTKDKDVGFQIMVSGAKYFDQTYDILVTDMPGGTYTPTYNIYAEAYFKMHVKNMTNSNQIGYTFTNTQPSCYTCCNQSPINGVGTSYDTTVFCKTYGSQKIHVQWSVLKNGNYHQLDSMVYCAPFDTTSFVLYY
ncbi:MAG: carboxypeptidase-like regulatory domain-containing protein [Bacteroidota bacterium]